MCVRTALDEKRLRRNDLLMMAAVGAGFTVGAVLCRWTGFDWN